MPEAIQEFVHSANAPLRVDRQRGVLRGVKLLGIESKNGRRYREDALRDAAPLYESSKVNVNHPKGGPFAPRDYQDRIGVIRGVKLRAGEGLFGDLHFNPKHRLAEQLMWDAEHEPANVGLSHNVLARTTRDGATTVVEAITKVESVDLVADPATTRGLFEQTEAEPEELPRPEPPHDGRPVEIRWEALTPALVEQHRPDLVRELRRLADEELRARGELLARRERIHELLLEHNLLSVRGDAAAPALVSKAFYESLLEAPDEERLRRLIEERAALVRSLRDESSGGNPPASRDQWDVLFPRNADRIASGKDFALAVRA